MKIAFHTNEICIRGSSVAIYDYAHYNELILKNQSIIIVPKKGFSKSYDKAIEKFKKRFNIYIYSELDEMEHILLSEKCNILYCIKYGKNDNVFSRRIKTVVHCVFDMSDPHGDVYAGVSETLAKKFKQSVFVPHMIGLEPDLKKRNLRDELKIPKDALVYGRYGGKDTFNLVFCFEAIKNIVNSYPNIFFIFINTPRFIVHKQVIYLNEIVSNEDKNKFINTCDAFIECGTMGHTFGLALGEFSVNNKPIIAISRDRNLMNNAHFEILKDKAIYFDYRQQFENILINFDKEKYESQDNNCYKDYTPEKVMRIFEKVFIED